MCFKWYIVHTYSGYELKAELALKERIQSHKMSDMFEEILVPTENVVEMKKGERKTSTRKFFPGYMLVKMKMSEKTWHLVKNTPKISGFVGGTIDPPAVPQREIDRITKQMKEGMLKPKPKQSFEDGDNIRVIDGPFSNFNGIIEKVNPEKGKVRVLVSIFGRATPVDLDFTQIERC